MNNDDFNELDELNEEGLDSPEQMSQNSYNNNLNKTSNVLQRNRNTISRSDADIFNGRKSLSKKNSDSEKLRNIRRNNGQVVPNMDISDETGTSEISNRETSQSSNNEQANQKFKENAEKLKNAASSFNNKGSKSGSNLIKAKNAEKIAAKTSKVLISKKAKMYAFIAIGVSIGFILLIILLNSIIMNDTDESYTIATTNGFYSNKMSEEELIDYLSYISICPGLKDIKIMAEEHGISTEEGINFEVVNALASTEEGIILSCLNALEYYRSLKNEYVENKKKCNPNQNFWKREDGNLTYVQSEFLQNKKAQNYFIGDHWKDDPDCQIVLPTNLISETMSFGLTDQELFRANYTNTVNYEEYYKDHRKLANALSDFVHETCYKWMWYNPKTKQWQYEACEGCTKEKKAHDGYYFEISFSKYVCFLKYGDSCLHPNYRGVPSEKFPDLQYLEHECVGPEDDAITYDSNGSSQKSESDKKCWECVSSGQKDAENVSYRWQKSDPSSGTLYCVSTDKTEAECSKEKCWYCTTTKNGQEVGSYRWQESDPSSGTNYCKNVHMTKDECGKVCWVYGEGANAEYRWQESDPSDPGKRYNKTNLGKDECKQKDKSITKVVWCGDSLTYGYTSGVNDDSNAPWRTMATLVGVPVEHYYHDGNPIGKRAHEIMEACDFSDPDALYIIWAGNTDYGEGASVESVIETLNPYLSKIDNYIVVGTQDSQGKNINLINGTLSKEYGEKFIDIQPIVGANETAGTIHFKAETYAQIGEAITDKARDLGYDI